MTGMTCMLAWRAWQHGDMICMMCMACIVYTMTCMTATQQTISSRRLHTYVHTYAPSTRPSTRNVQNCGGKGSKQPLQTVFRTGRNDVQKRASCMRAADTNLSARVQSIHERQQRRYDGVVDLRGAENVWKFGKPHGRLNDAGRFHSHFLEQH
eukprot:354102-Chlamydomonas_euryale.AAC.1